MSREEMIGRKFGRWTVIERSKNNKNGHLKWLCKCDCGTVKAVGAGSLKSGNSKSCGCAKVELRTTHGMTGTPEYICWQSMWRRCTGKTHDNYDRYKDKAPPDRWKDFTKFYEDMGPRPSLKYTIERIDNSKPYGPDNCCWATMKTQSRNKKNVRWIEFDGKKMILADWAAHLNINKFTLRGRLNKWPVEKALTSPKRKNQHG